MSREAQHGRGNSFVRSREIARGDHGTQQRRSWPQRPWEFSVTGGRDAESRHAERVGCVSAMIAEVLAPGSSIVECIRFAAPLHDVGKISVSASILLKPGRLTPAEFDAVKNHVTAGHRILRPANGGPRMLAMAAVIARSHHEHWDGSGYLEGLRGEAIPLPARIVAVADAFDALTHQRPYKAAWPVDFALDEIRASAGTHFDPRIVAAFEQLDHATLLDMPNSRITLLSRPRPPATGHRGLMTLPTAPHELPLGCDTGT